MAAGLTDEVYDYEWLSEPVKLMHPPRIQTDAIPAQDMGWLGCCSAWHSVC